MTEKSNPNVNLRRDQLPDEAEAWINVPRRRWRASPIALEGPTVSPGRPPLVSFCAVSAAGLSASACRAWTTIDRASIEGWVAVLILPHGKAAQARSSAALSAPERVLPFCVASHADWERVGIIGALVTAKVIKGLIGRDPMGGLYLTKEGRAALAAMLPTVT
jgi:hypothetical protein